MSNILIYISTGFILFAYLGYFIFILFEKNKNISDNSGFEVTKDIISEYDSINVIERKGYFSFYNIKRKVVKLSTSSYYGKDLSSISLSLLEAGISAIDNNKNKYINIIRIVFSNLKILYIFPVLAFLINNLSFNVNDVKVNIILMFLFILISYIIIDIKKTAYVWIVDNIDKIKDISKDNSLKILNFIDIVILFDRCIFFGEFLMICRLILILFKF